MRMKIFRKDVKKHFFKKRKHKNYMKILPKAACENKSSAVNHKGNKPQ